MIISNRWMKQQLQEGGFVKSSWYLRSSNNLFTYGNKLENSVARMRYDGQGFQTYRVSDEYFNGFSIQFEI